MRAESERACYPILYNRGQLDIATITVTFIEDRGHTKVVKDTQNSVLVSGSTSNQIKSKTNLSNSLDFGVKGFTCSTRGITSKIKRCFKSLRGTVKMEHSFFRK